MVVYRCHFNKRAFYFPSLSHSKISALHAGFKKDLFLKITILGELPLDGK